MTGVISHLRLPALLLSSACVCAGHAYAQAPQRDLLPQTFLDRQQITQSPPDAAEKDARRRAAEESKRLADELAREKAKPGEADGRATSAPQATIAIPPPEAKPAAEPPPAEKPPAVAIVPPPVPASRPAAASQISPPPVASPQPPAASPAEIERLIAQGEKRLKEGDIASARLFYQRAAETGSVTAARILGRLFDTVALSSLGVRGVAGDAEKAKFWLGFADRLERGEAPQPPRQ